MNIKKQLGTKIKRLRQNRGFTQEQLAEKLDIATRTLCGIENGENFLTAETLEKILRVLNISSSELFAFDHLRPQEELVEEIIHDLRDIKSREKIENIYKLIKAIITE
ncbi:helix-turn-helix transcriptional regulator [Spirochaetes bacterium]|uniref:Helix-turn-helix transcriptional regulator n=1 Tax=Candidatus Scatousia excrementipullorum TaxID=2840936 RepID=A0A9D9GWZ6_9BACT|nr:helix-turn-helix transcriptional regulator [Candidatus Scatousia excrementipullorum]